jgi:hypothetical protein
MSAAWRTLKVRPASGRAGGDIPEVAAALHEREGIAGAFKREDLIDHGPQSVRCDGAVHRFPANQP